MPSSLNQILILVAFVIPGFVMVRVKRLSYPVVTDSLQTTLLDSLALSCDRIHDALKKETPTERPVERRQTATAKVVGAPRVGGLHHRYHWQAAA